MTSPSEPRYTLDDDPAGEALRNAFRERKVKADPAELPDPAELWDALQGDLEPPRLREMIERTADSPELAEEWRLARALDQEIQEQGQETTDSQPATNQPPWQHWQLAIAALLLLAVGAWMLVSWQAEHSLPQGGDPIVRDGGDQRLVSLLEDDAELSREQPVLRWRGPEGARYDVRVSDPALELLAEARGLSEPRFELPIEVVAELPPGSEILWQVEATLASGERLVSETFANRFK